MSKFQVNDIYKIVIAVAILITALSVAYYYVIFLPQNQKAELALDLMKEKRIQEELSKKEAEERERQDELDDCFYQVAMDAEEKLMLGVNERVIDTEFEKGNEDCYKKYQ